jgi:hypothetical protein
VFGMERIARPLQDVRGRIAHAMRDTNEALCTYARCAMRRTCAVSSRARGGQNAAGAFPPGTARRNSAGSTSIQIWRVCLDGDWQRRADANEVCPPRRIVTASWREFADCDKGERVVPCLPAGGHNMLTSGPPGSGRTSLARPLPSANLPSHPGADRQGKCGAG